MRQAISVFLVLGVLGACSATSVGSMDPVDGGACSKNGATATGADGCTQCTCADKLWSCQSDACEAKACKSGERKLADDGCNACKCDAQGAWVCTSGAACPGGDGGAPAVDGGGSGAAVGMTSGGSSSGITGTGPVTVPVLGRCPGTLAVPPDPPPAGATKQPCDIYAEDGGPCVAAHSTVRALYASYEGPLYQLRRIDGMTRDITPTAAGGLADSAAHDSFCTGSACTISLIYDQSGQGNHLTKAPPGGAKSTPDTEARAAAGLGTVAGQKVYGLKVAPGVGYRNNDACGTASGDDAETEYMVVAGADHNNGCCFDYGNMERDSRDDGEGSTEAVYFGSITIWGKGAGVGPWVMADLENGLWAGNVTPYNGNSSLDHKYVTAMVKGDAAGKNHWAIKSGDAQVGVLTTPFDGPRPSDRYNPMHKQGGVGLGTAGDNSSAAQGTFFEGIMTAHFSSDAADDAVQANIVSVYGTP
jgi:non-reducing end alpha-L-arabinofuranosidase